MHHLRHLRSARVAVAVVLACTDVLFALAVMVFVLFSGTLSSDEVRAVRAGGTDGQLFTLGCALEPSIKM